MAENLESNPINDEGPKSRKDSRIPDRQKVTRQVATVGVGGNIFLAAFKLFAGIFGNSTAMISDAVHSLSDVVATAIAFAGVRLAERDADSDQEGRAAEVDTLERRYHHTDNGRQSRDQRQENRTDDRNSRHYFVQIVFSCLARSDARDKAAVRFHVIRNFIRVESNARVEVCEEDDQDYV